MVPNSKTFLTTKFHLYTIGCFYLLQTFLTRDIASFPSPSSFFSSSNDFPFYTQKKPKSELHVNDKNLHVHVYIHWLFNHNMVIILCTHTPEISVPHSKEACEGGRFIALFDFVYRGIRVPACRVCIHIFLQFIYR